MLICDSANIAFVQIPKNGSKSIRQALLNSFGLDHSAFAADLGWSVEQFEDAYANGSQDYLPAVGKNNLDHLTLQVYREHLPVSFAAFRRAQSFALIRRPRERFLSALMQRIGQFHRIKDIRIDNPLVAQEARLVCDWLADRDQFTDREFIHFARQIDYVDLDGERVVNAIFPIENTSAAQDWIEGLTGTSIGIAHEHARREPKKLAKFLLPPLRLAARTLLNQRVRQAIYPLWRNSRLFSDAAKRYDSVDFGPQVEDFIAQYYAADLALYQEAKAQMSITAKLESA